MVDTRIEEGRRITKRYAGWSAGTGFIPLPMLDIAALMATQVAMVNSLAHLYAVPFEQERIRGVLSSVVGGALPQTAAATGVPSLLKFIPVVGPLLGFATMPAMAAASTMAVGELFIRHFSAGGTFDDVETAVQAPLPVDSALSATTDSAAVAPVDPDLDEPARPARSRGARRTATPPHDDEI
jgi:uncharacterized protein (DUF697 family)